MSRESALSQRPPSAPSLVQSKSSASFAASMPSLRTTGASTYHHPGPSGYRQALKSCHAKGGRLSSASIPGGRTTQQALRPPNHGNG